jgi:hypothetical protein
MLAPGWLRDLITDPRPIAAAAAKPSATPIKELSAENQNDVFMLFISSVRRSTFHRTRDFFRQPLSGLNPEILERFQVVDDVCHGGALFDRKK